VTEPLAADTPLDVEARQVRAWRAMSAADQAALVAGLSQTAFDVARAGVRQRHPLASEREVFLRMAMLTLGLDLAARVYPETIGLQ
jgi:hypothetical protein